METRLNVSCLYGSASVVFCSADRAVDEVFHSVIESIIEVAADVNAGCNFADA